MDRLDGVGVRRGRPRAEPAARTATLLRDAIRADPEAVRSAPRTSRRFGPDPALLVKLLDAGERLPVHVHPDGAFAAEHLGTAFGKTEAWIVVGAAHAGTAVHVGFRDDVAADTLAAWVRDQDRDALLGALVPRPGAAPATRSSSPPARRTRSARAC